MSRRKALRLAFTILLATVLLLPPASALAQGQQLVGTWTVVPTQDGQPQSLLLMVAHGDGTLITISSTPGASNGGGEWLRVNDRAYALTFFQFTYDPNGQFLGITRLRANLEVGAPATTFTGAYQTDLFDPTGTVVFSAQGSLAGNRVGIERL